MRISNTENACQQLRWGLSKEEIAEEKTEVFRSAGCGFEPLADKSNSLKRHAYDSSS